MQNVDACPKEKECEQIGKMKDRRINYERGNNKSGRNDRPVLFSERWFEDRPGIGRIHMRTADTEGNDTIYGITGKIGIKAE